LPDLSSSQPDGLIFQVQKFTENTVIESQAIHEAISDLWTSACSRTRARWQPGFDFPDGRQFPNTLLVTCSYGGDDRGCE